MCNMLIVSMIPIAFQKTVFWPPKDGLLQPERRHIGSQKTVSWKTAFNSLSKNSTLSTIFLNFASNYINSLPYIYG